MASSLPIGVCSWSIDRFDPLRAVRVAAEELDLRTVQLGFFTRKVVDETDPVALSEAATQLRVSICGTFLAFDGEDYTSIEAIARTGGLMPEGEYEGRRETLRRAVAITASVADAMGDLGRARAIAIHAGTVPSDSAAVDYPNLVTRAREFADICREHGLRLLLETGREPASVLAAFIAAVARDNVGVNFDPANFIIYNADDPVQSIAALKPLIGLVHLKDAIRPAPGEKHSFGSPADFGQGEVQVPRVVSKLRASGYAGPLLIETAQRGGLAAIRDAAGFLRSMF